MSLPRSSWISSGRVTTRVASSESQSTSTITGITYRTHRRVAIRDPHLFVTSKAGHRNRTGRLQQKPLSRAPLTAVTAQLPVSGVFRLLSKFGELLAYARPGDTVHISEMFRLVRGTGHILDVLDVLHRDRLTLRVHDGAFSAMDLTARHPRTGELLSTVKFLVQTLAAAGELQRDLQRELTYDGLRAAEAKGNKGGRRPALTGKTIADVRAAYLEGRSIAALAREHDVSRGAIRTAVADLLPEYTAVDPGAPAPELPVVLDMPGKVTSTAGPLGSTTTATSACG
ncbi:recombinase family protein [Streptomyces inhibens]|uniref:recombinase family protein n=1 Tax=Streptomyces inhibens TaxID=2293571 RepID=UPI0037900BB1